MIGVLLIKTYFVIMFENKVFSKEDHIVIIIKYIGKKKSWSIRMYI